MKQYPATQIRNIALLGHGGSGKTTLADALLFHAKAINRIGKTDDSTTTMDFDPEEKKRKTSISTAVFPIEHNNSKLNIIDAPGLFDFAGGMHEALAAADSALIVLSGKSGLAIGAQMCFGLVKKKNKACAFFISKLDASNANFYKVMDSLIENYGTSVCPLVVPYMQGEKLVSYVNLIEDKAYTYDGATPKETDMPEDDNIENMRNIMLEAVASADEDLMEKYFSGEKFTKEEICKGLSAGIKSGDIHPVLCGAGQTGEAVDMALNILTDIMPDSTCGNYKQIVESKETDIACDPDGPFAALVFKTIADPFVGKLSYFKVISGSIKPDSQIINARTGDQERISKLVWIKASQQEETSCISAGDIGAVAKLSSVLTGDTLCSKDNRITLSPIDFPAPSLSMAVYTKGKGDEDKISTGLFRLAEEDPTITVETNNETKELILSGLGESHLDVIVSKLKTKFGVDVELKIPKVAYRETIRKKVKVQGKHKKQSGGHGQYGDVWIEFEPCDSDDLVFEEKIFGGAVPKNFFPAIEKGLRESMQKGVLAGYPMVGIKATLVDGSYHSVDSSEMSFKLAAALAYRNGIPQASPVLLEPIGTLKVNVLDEHMGDVIGEINKRRGRVLGMNPAENNMQEIVAEVPIAKMGDFSTAMRSITQGRSTFTLTFERYEEAPPMIAQKVIEEANAAE